MGNSGRPLSLLQLGMILGLSERQAARLKRSRDPRVLFIQRADLIWRESYQWEKTADEIEAIGRDITLAEPTLGLRVIEVARSIRAFLENPPACPWRETAREWVHGPEE